LRAENLFDFVQASQKSDRAKALTASAPAYGVESRSQLMPSTSAQRLRQIKAARHWQPYTC